MTTPHKPDPARIDKFHFESSAEGEHPRRIRTIGSNTANYYDVFGLQPRLLIDVEALREAFLTLSREFHPDFFGNAEPALKAESERRTALLNNAHKTLRDPQKRAEYLIFLIADDIESNKNAVPPELLEEVFEIQEAGEELREARIEADEQKLAAAEAKVIPLRDEVKQARAKLEQELEQQFADFDKLLDGGAAPESKLAREQLKRIRLTLDRMNYLRTVLRNLL